MAAYPFLAKHLNLDLAEVQDADGKIDESFVVVEEREEMLVFGENNPYPEDSAYNISGNTVTCITYGYNLILLFGIVSRDTVLYITSASGQINC